MKHTVFWNGLLMHCVIYITNRRENRGESFRTAFKGLGGLRALTVAPFMALSASAPSAVERCVKESLELRDCVMVKEHTNVHQSHSQNDSGDLRGVAGGDGELGCLCGKAGTSHLCDGSAHSSGCVVNGSNAMAAV